MRLHPLIANTVALWQFQGNMSDSGPNGLGLSVATGTEQYTTIDTCTQGFKFDGSTKLIAALSTLLQITGDMTFEWIMKQAGTQEETYFCCANPAGRSGGAFADRIGSTYTYFWAATEHASLTNNNIGSNSPSAGYGDILTWNQFNFGIGAFHHYAARILTIGGVPTFAFFKDGVKGTNSVPSLGTGASGVERFYVGGNEGGQALLTTNSVMASVRLLSYGRADSDIAADAFAALSPCSAFVNYRGALTRMVG